MNRKQLLAALTAAGYTGKADLADIKQYLANEGRDSDSITINDETHKIDDVFAKAAPLSAKVDAEADEPVIVAPSKKDATGYKKTVGKLEGKGEIGVIVKGRDRSYKRYETLIANRSNPNASNREKAVFDTPEDAETFGAWSRLNLAAQINKSYKAEGEDRDIIQKAGLTYDNSLGGATVPQEFMNSLIWRTEQYGVARRLAQVVRMNSDNMVIPRRTGLVTMGFVAEGSGPTAQENRYDNVELTARKAIGLFQVSTELFEDSAINQSNEYADSVAEAQALLEDQIYFLGDGSATYGGFNGLANALPSAAYLSGVAWGSITTANIQNAMGSVQNVKNGNLAFVCSRQFYFQVLARLDKATSQFKELAGANPSFTAGSIAVGNFLGYPVYISQVLPTATGANKAAYFGDFSGISKIGDRRQLSLDVSREYAFNADLITMRATARLAVNVHGDGRNSTYGPVVCIQGA